MKKYSELEKNRFKEKLEITFFDNTNDASILLPPMLVQPLIENAIKHGILHLKSKGQITVDFSIQNDILKIVVEDNGVGRSFSSTVGSKNHNSLGLKNIEQRLALLNEKNKTKAHLIEIMDLHHNSTVAGTKVTIQLLVKRAT